MPNKAARCAKITIEVTRSVREDFRSDFEEATRHLPSERSFRSELKYSLAESGISDRRSRDFRFLPRSATFLEFDSTDAAQALAYYQCEFEGPVELIERLTDASYAP